MYLIHDISIAYMFTIIPINNTVLSEASSKCCTQEKVMSCESEARKLGTNKLSINIECSIVISLVHLPD